MTDAVEFDGGDILDFLAQVKEILTKFNVDLARLKDILPLLQTVVSEDHHSVDGMKATVEALIDLADIVVLDDHTVVSLRSLLENETLLTFAVWTYNKLTNYQPEGFGDQPLVVGGQLVQAIPLPDLQTILPIILWIIELIKKLQG